MRFLIYAACIGALIGACGVSVIDEPFKFYALDIPLLGIGWVLLEMK